MSDTSLSASPDHPRHRSTLRGHAAAERSFLDAWTADRLHHAWLIEGPRGIGKAIAFLYARLGAKLVICGREVPGDTYRNLRIFPSYSGETFKHILVPVWLLVYTYGRKSFQVLANGHTGKIAGEYPKSFWNTNAT